MKKDNFIYVKHIFDAILLIESYIHNINFIDFKQKRILQDGVIRQLEIIGEATKNLTPSFKKIHTAIPWKDMAGMRDKLIHSYFGVDINAVWKTAIKDIPFLKIEINKLLDNNKQLSLL